MRLLFLALLCSVALPALAAGGKPLVADLSQYRVEIDSRFTGADLLLFGARNDTGDIIVVVRGPERNFIVRKKERVAGIWINKKQITFNQVPAYYSVASSKPFDQMGDIALFPPLRVGADTLLDAPGEDEKLLVEFRKAFLHYQQKHRLFSEEVSAVNFVEDTLFKSFILFPDNIPRGAYTAEIYLFNDGELISMQSIPIRVYKKGFDAFVYELAHGYPILYGLAAVFIALGAGWGASEIFRKI